MSHPLPILENPHFNRRVTDDLGHELRASAAPSTLQLNLGAVCNLACRHCHVESSPARRGVDENMSQATARQIAAWALKQPWISTIDLTGGSPEMNPNFRWLIETFHEANLHIMDRCNPTIIEWTDPTNGQTFDWVPTFLAAHRVEVVASLPCYEPDNVNHQRGRGAFDASIVGLQRLCEVGYGSDPKLTLNLVYNPIGPTLPPPQTSLEDAYRDSLEGRFGIVFNELWTIANMPIKRWRHDLERTGTLDSYMDLLIGSFNAQTVDHLMCRHLISVDPLGRVYDCDFNQALSLPSPGLQDRHVWDLCHDDIASRLIATADHCYGCTAGHGSSCGGALTDVRNPCESH